MKKRTLFSLLLVTAAAVAAVTAAAMRENAAALTAQRNLEYTYRRAFGELTDCVSAMETALEKAGYANTATQQSGIAAHLMEQAGGAKAALAALPLQEDTMEQVQKFLTQTEDFANTLHQKIAAGQKLKEADFEIIDQLYDYAALLKANLILLQEKFDGQDLAPGESTTVMAKLQLADSPDTLSDGLADSAQEFRDYPTLIYDGPFSDHIAQQKAKLIENAAEVSPEQAKQTAAAFFDLPQAQLEQTDDTAGNLPAYNFICGEKRITVTKQGGVVLSLLDSRTVTEARLDADAARAKAAAFLEQNHLGDHKESYYSIHDNLCTVQFFAVQDGAILYGDLIKVTVALDDGSIAEYDATGYVLNHHHRDLPAPQIPIAQARDTVSPRLTILHEQMALIPTPGGREVLCYEFHCKSKTEDEVLVYLNAETGLEEQILILLRGDDGILTR